MKISNAIFALTVLGISSPASAAVLNTSVWSFNGGETQSNGATATTSAKVGDYITFYDVLGDGSTNWVLKITDLQNQLDTSDILVNQSASLVEASPFVFQADYVGSRSPFVLATHVASSFVSAVDGSAVTLTNVRFRINDLDGYGYPNVNLADFVAASGVTSVGVATSPETTHLVVADDTYAGTGGKIVYAKPTGPEGWLGLPNTISDANSDAYLQYASLSSTNIVLGAIFPGGVGVGETRGIGIYSAEYDAVFTPDVPNISPVPLPAAAPLLIAGLGAIGFAARRRKSA